MATTAVTAQRGPGEAAAWAVGRTRRAHPIIVPQEEPFLRAWSTRARQAAKEDRRQGGAAAQRPGRRRRQRRARNACPKGKEARPQAGVNGADGVRPYGSQPQVITVPNSSVLGPFARRRF